MEEGLLQEKKKQKWPYSLEIQNIPSELDS